MDTTTMVFLVGLAFICAATVQMIKHLLKPPESRLKSFLKWARNVFDSLWGMG